MAVTSVADFFKLLEKSALLSAEQFQAARQQWSGESDPKAVARKLLTEGQLTKWQALQLLNGRSGLTIGPYRLRDALAGDGAVRAFRAQHAETGQLVELRSLSRSHAAERPEAVDEFVADAERAAAASKRKVLEVHRPDGPDEMCYVVLQEAGGGPAAAAPAASADSSADASAAAGAVAPAGADQPADTAAAKPRQKDSGKPSTQPTAETPAASEARPPKLKPKAKPAEPTPARCASDAAEAKDKAAPATSAESKTEIKIPELDAAAPAALGVPADFKITRGKRRKKAGAAPAGKPAKPAAADQAAKSEAAEPAEGGEAAEGDVGAAPAGSAKRALSPAMLIGGAVGGGLLLVVALVVVAWLVFSGGDSAEVADAGDAKPSAEQATQAPQEGEAKPAEPAAEVQPEASEPADPVVSDPVVEVAPAASPEPKPEAKIEPAAPDAKTDAKTDAAAPTTAKPADAPAAPAAEGGKEPAASESATQTAKPDAAKTETPANEPADTKPADTKPADKEPAADEKATDKEPAGKKTADKEAAKKESDKKPPAPPAGKKPFADLKALAMLPDVSDTNPLDLGPVYVPADELCFVKLRGGEKARRGTEQLIMKNANEGLADKEWEISVRDAGGTETIIASLQLNDKSRLIFKWTANAKSQDAAPYLCNCALSLSCAGESKAVTFREATPVDPMVVDFGKPSSKKDWPIKMCPDPEAVRFVITGVQGAKCTVDPAEPVPAKKTTVSVKIEDGGGMLSLKIDASLGNDFQLTASPQIKLSQEAPKPDRFVRRMFENQLKQAQAQNEALKQQIQGLQQYAKSAAKDAKQAEQRLPVFELEGRNSEALVQNMKKIDDLLKGLGEGMKIQFRVVYDADSTEVVLLKSG